ncbi:cyclase family protein [Nocardia rhizosphaerihabitans]|uniref:Cyclase n=1 Tax=Nocardia rhizosphaerihabitans TaxID=1691570 RepID=A0ABQ2K6I8_9NOCA|nr:cyclase family protein [Nocardia rhizosphaerihabitans]GGN68183.1 cyclase [Nocardia rhizosphaerihabitans]
MCTPEIVRLAHDGAPRPSRRALLGLAGLTALAAVAPAPAVAAPRSGGVVDLTHTLTPELPVWPGNPPMVKVPVAWHASGGFGQFALGYWEHTGTHVDAPAHRIPGATTTDALAVDDLVASLVVIDISAKAAIDTDAMVTVADIDRWRSQHGDIPERAFVAMYSGWEDRIPRPSTFLNLDERGRPHAPGFSAEAAEYLVTHCGIVGVGVDTLSLDSGADPEFGAHTAILGAGHYGVEMLANLAAVPVTGATVVVGAPKHAGGTGGPCRVLALT